VSGSIPLSSSREYRRESVLYRPRRISPGPIAFGRSGTRSKLFHAAVDQGINFFPTIRGTTIKGRANGAWGKALKGYRDRVFVMTKFDGTHERVGPSNNSMNHCRGCRWITSTFGNFTKISGWKIRIAFFFADGGGRRSDAGSQAGRQKSATTGFYRAQRSERSPPHARKWPTSTIFDSTRLQMPLNVMDAHFRSFGANVVPILVLEKDCGAGDENRWGTSIS